MPLTKDDVFEARLSERQPLALATGEGGLRRAAGRSDDDCPTRCQMIAEILRGRKVRSAWPAARGEHRRIEVRERFRFEVTK